MAVACGGCLCEVAHGHVDGYCNVLIIDDTRHMPILSILTWLGKMCSTIRSENVAKTYNISRDTQDAWLPHVTPSFLH